MERKQEKDPNDRWLKKVRFLTQALIVSGLLNIALIVSFLSTLLKERPLSMALNLPVKEVFSKKKELCNRECLKNYASLSFKELINLLLDKQYVENGYTKRDLALGILVYFQDFNIEKALSGQSFQKRTLSFPYQESTKEITLFPGLSEMQYERVFRYATTEKWPLTTNGLVTRLQKEKAPRELSLEQAFLATPEFFSLYALFQKGEAVIEPKEVLTLACEMKWESLEPFFKEATPPNEQSIEKRRKLLLEALSQKSPTAARLLLKTDFDYSSKKLEDGQVVEMLDFFEQKNEDAEHFCKEMLKSARSDEVRQKSASRLYRLAGEEMPQPYNYQKAVERFIPSFERVKEKAGKTKEKKETLGKEKLGTLLNKGKRIHKVQDGENLWKIAKKYHVRIEDLIRLNRLENDRLRPGRQLILPAKEKTTESESTKAKSSKK